MLKTRGEKLLRYPLPVAVDLSPPTALKEGVSLLSEIIATHDSMMFPPLGKRPPDFHPVFSAVLDPIVHMCEQAAEAHKSKGAILSSRRSRASSDPSQMRRSSIDAILDSGRSTSLCQSAEDFSHQLPMRNSTTSAGARRCN